jgi:hypothetical protein
MLAHSQAVKSSFSISTETTSCSNLFGLSETGLRRRRVQHKNCEALSLGIDAVRGIRTNAFHNAQSSKQEIAFTWNFIGASDVNTEQADESDAFPIVILPRR